MRAISLWQPWASAIAVGAKRVETRHWSTTYRGPLAIHAAKRKVINELIHYKSTWNWCAALAPLGWSMGGNHSVDFIRGGYGLPFGAIVATCNLVDCRPSESFTQAELHTRRFQEGKTDEHYSWNEGMMGNFELGRFGWVLSDIKPTRWPIPFKGGQGFFNVPDELLVRERP